MTHRGNISRHVRKNTCTERLTKYTSPKVRHPIPDVFSIPRICFVIQDASSAGGARAIVTSTNFVFRFDLEKPLPRHLPENGGSGTRDIQSKRIHPKTTQRD